MSIEITGDEQSAHEVLAMLKHWDEAVANMDIQALADLCVEEVSLIDVSTHLTGIQAYKQLWKRYLPVKVGNIRVYREAIKMIAQPELAVLHCFSKVDQIDATPNLEVFWCRTTICFQKVEGAWKVAHQHISMPIQLETGLPILLSEVS
ncbi:nuclear transport factor 2 family protein [Acinetobacter tandoii]|nr:nuclear transport factor 2 family protein [Acinetobacter tandoii]